MRLPDGLQFVAVIAEIVIVVIFLLGLLGGLVDREVEISYIVTGDEPTANLYVETPNGSEEHERQPLPFKVTYKFQKDEFVKISAGNFMADKPGTITCTIVADGKVVHQASSTGENVRASCGGRAGSGKPVPGATIPQLTTPAHP
ncbi:hypothetical protein [Actinomadura sp. BRA 177]|uniref:hypothetical protein n=1 Tax=Actinomadura sp. BRA 177 TaxID=2745202 RepID=UPI001595BDBA|nr:hypothetical protein [Actinomadura sp. BRA 177]NVI86130.1 hypothetical protein [Actinomadura sp. BRA 177]